jgi:hypothetical protein
MKKTIEEIKADYHLFIDIQMGKYLSSRNKNEFNSDEEAKLVMNKIIEVYNQKIAPDHLRLDNLNEAAKASWFNSIEIEFGKPDSTYSPVKTPPAISKVTKNFISFYNDALPFLPEGAIMYLIFAGPALEAYGYPLDRFRKIIEGEKPTEIEEDLLLWAYDLSFSVAEACLEKDKVEKDLLIEYSISIAEEELDDETAKKVVEEIYSNFEEDFSGFEKKKQKPKRKKGKRKK